MVGVGCLMRNLGGVCVGGGSSVKLTDQSTLSWAVAKFVLLLDLNIY